MADTTDPRITGWLLDRDDREALLARFPPVYPDVVAHHVTLDGSATAGSALPEAPRSSAVIGVTDDGAGVQALVVALDGTTDRPDGSTYHMTWSLDRAAGRTPIESNDVIRKLGWKAVEPVAVRLSPAWL